MLDKTQKTLEFYVIYEFDIEESDSVRFYHPPHRRSLWNITEKSDHDGELSYANLPKHRKLVAILTRDQFEEFLSHTGLYAETTETMGMLTGIGWLPAIPFTADNTKAYQNAYVCPLPRIIHNENESVDFTRQWNRLSKTVIDFYS